MQIRFVFCLVFLLYSQTSHAQSEGGLSLSSVSPFPVGFAVDPVLLKSDRVFRELFIKHGDGLTATNSMKPSRIIREKGRYHFEEADALIDFAVKNNKRVHGHTLVWFNESAPRWLKEIRDSATLENNLREYIRVVGEHFRGKVKSWDVVNEVFDDLAGDVRIADYNEKGAALLNLGGVLGKDYAARMFQYAHQADPEALLFYNDYGQETNPGKLNHIIRMVKDFKARGIPIHGLGIQMHINIDTPESGIEKVIASFAATGLQVHISELDVSMNTGKTKQFRPGAAQFLQQKQKYRFVVETYRRLVPASQQYGITTWGVGDKDSWIPQFCNCSDFPLLFDQEYQPKPALEGYFEGVGTK